MKNIKIYKSFLGKMYFIKTETKDEDVIKMLTYAIEQTADERGVPFGIIIEMLRNEHRKKG